MEPLTAGEIITLAFTKAFEKITLTKIKRLYDLLRDKMYANQEDKPDFEKVADDLELVMKSDPNFAQEIQKLAYEIRQEIRVERVGVLVVHGIGKQKQYEHLTWIVRNIAKTLKDDNSQGSLEIQITTNFSKNSDIKKVEKGCFFDTEASASIIVKNQKNLITQMDFHEVWWADLGEETTLKTLFSFWTWALSLWTTSGYFENGIIDNNQERRRLPEKTKDKKEIKIIERLILFGISLIAFLILPVLVVISKFLSLFDIRILQLDTLSQYLSRVQIFQQRFRNSLGPLEDFDQPPRVVIRRRMVEALIKMALKEYDRWYIISHSQGTVLAFNGLMETEQILPNYLSKELWEEIKLSSLYKKATENKDKASGCMRPKRPYWLDSEDLIDRRKLFVKLKGFITYGSPLKKFARLWPAIVYLNQDEKVFHRNFEWINIYDPTDPVASPIEEYFTPKDQSIDCNDYKAPYPIDVAYRINGMNIHLLSHIAYLNYSYSQKNICISQISKWLLNNSSFSKDCFPKISPWQDKLWVGTRMFIWWMLGICNSIILAWLFCHPLIDKIISYLPIYIKQHRIIRWICSQSYLSYLCWWDHFFLDILIVVIWGFIVVFLSGILNKTLRLKNSRNKGKAMEDIEDYLSQNSNISFSLKNLYEKFCFYSQETVKQALEELKNQKIIDKTEGNKFCFFVISTLR